MYNNVLLSRYFPVKSKMHDMDPFAKMLCTIIFILTLVITNSFSVILLLIIVDLIMLLRSNVPLRLYGKTIKSTTPVLLIVIITTLLLGIDYILILFWIIKIILIVLYTSILTFTSTPTEITYGFQKVLAPLKLIGIPTSRVALDLTMTIRYIPIMIEQTQRIKKAQASRGIDYDNSGLFGRMKAFFSLIGPVFRISNRRTNELLTAMEIRMYTVYNKRTSYRTKFWGFKDTFIVFLHLIILIMFIYKEVMGYGSLLDNFFVRWIWF
ncbi:MAG: energy-coupling factor transporter transmembrane protein EcfT [Firmicutes bacterium]|nr:energy-coupling factor transporter transmembrane protein EcfT [Bacillota bacterium]